MRIPTATWLLVLLFCYMHLCGHVLVVSAALCLDDQRSLLLNFKDELVGDISTSGKLSTWNESIACCEWGGVTCDHDGHVIGLDLSGELTTYDITSSSSLFDFRHLESLNLAENEWFWPQVIPEFSKLSNLTYLNLSHAAYFEGPVPIGISHLTRLVTLDISVDIEMAFILPEIRDLQMFLQNLTKIRQLHLDGVTVSAQGPEWTAALLQIPALQEVSMSYCNLSGPLQPSLAMLENLSVINLDQNNLSSVVPESYASFKNLTTLSLSGCGLTGVFPHNIFQVPTLSFIDISDNELLCGFLPEFPLGGSLQSLLVAATNFTGPLPNSIGHLRNLSTLSLGSSQFNGTLPNSLSNLTQLVKIDLSGNRFFGPIPPLAMSRKLRYVYLSDNYLSGAISSNHFEGLVDLVDIDLHSNFFAGKIPTSIFMLPNLEYVTFSSNKFEGQLNVFMNATPSIQCLELNENHLEGSIPISLFQIEQLRILNLSFNKFSGSIDLSMNSKLGNLSELDLSGNSLSIVDATAAASSFPLFPNLGSLHLASCKMTKFPQFLKNQSQLIDLDLSNNRITGAVPCWISKLKFLVLLNISNNYLTNWEEPLLSNMSYLHVLDLHSNNFCGPLLSLPLDLRYLDFSSNNFSSGIPPNFGFHLSRTEFVSLSGNNLQGNIPTSICSASWLEVLDLSNNFLFGTIPQCLFSMNGTLLVLNLERNKLNGTIDTFPSSCRLRSLHLNGNSLGGKFPKYLISCTVLEVLDLGDNKIEDQFPCWVKSLTSLRVLILRSNKFHGFLKCQGTQEGWPLLQIFDISSNNFGGRIQPSFFESWNAMMAIENYGRSKNLSKLDRPRPIEYQMNYGTTYYRDKVTVTSKQQEMVLVKILTIFTAIDISNNTFEGSIPEDLGQLNALYILNLSHNALSGHIPSSLGNLKDLESLDLSSNKLSGEIPTELARLSFLEVLNLSYNHLVGRIPISTQIQSFDATSFKGNDGLCGPPLTPNCSGYGVQGTSSVASSSNKESSIDWNFIAAELGFASAIGIILFLLVLHKAWRIWYWESVDNILYRIFPQLDFVIECRGGQSYRVLRWKPY